MRHILSLLLAFMIPAVIFCGCSGADSSEASQESSEASSYEQSYYDAAVSKITQFIFSHTGNAPEQNYTYAISRDGSKLTLTFETGGTLKQILLKNDKLINAIDEAVSKYDIKKWNGFNEKKTSPSGETFELLIKYSDGSEIAAYGENSFPDNYIGIWNALGDVFSDYEEQNGIKRPPLTSETQSGQSDDETPLDSESAPSES